MSSPKFGKLNLFLPTITLGAWLQLLPLFVMFGTLWSVGISVFELQLTTVKFWEYLIYGWLYAALGYWIGLAILIRLLRVRWPAAVFACFYLFLYSINIAFLRQSGTVLQPFYLTIVDLSNWTHYLTAWTWLLILGLVINCAIAIFLICSQTQAIKQLPVRGLALLLAGLFLAPILRDAGFFTPTKIVVAAINVPQNGVWQTDQTFQLRSLAKNPVVIICKALMHLPKPMQIHPASDLASVSQILNAWHLPLGPRHYPSLELKPFNHIVVFATESMSLDFLAPYNTNLPPELTPFYASPAIRRAMFVNYKAVALPTQPGLSVMYNSHPNASGLLAGENEMSMIKSLNARGYETYFLMSATESFNDDATVFKNMGFKHVLGAKYWQADPRKAPFIEGWGLMDRVLYQAALDLLKQNQDKKIYIHIANADTHGPYPRDYFDSLKYPPLPDCIQHLTEDAHAQAILGSIFRHDYDLGLAIQEMRQQNLLDTQTLVVVTGDHNYPHAQFLNDIPGYPINYYTRIPLVFLSGQKLPEADLNQLHSQLDFAPTMMHLLGFPIPEGWWGESIFATNQAAPRVATANRNIVVETSNDKQTVSLDSPHGVKEKELVSLFTSIYTNSP